MATLPFPNTPIVYRGCSRSFAARLGGDPHWGPAISSPPFSTSASIFCRRSLEGGRASTYSTARNPFHHSPEVLPATITRYCWLARVNRFNVSLLRDRLSPAKLETTPATAWDM